MEIKVEHGFVTMISENEREQAMMELTRKRLKADKFKYHYDVINEHTYMTFSLDDMFEILTDGGI